ncbi:MAG: hypothetical protein GX777_03260 [Fastidiosipila sp.]|nr:hypothetical protein [Fastidiosipila sp.]
MRCPNCGQENEKDNISCLLCGSLLPAASVDEKDQKYSDSDPDHAIYTEGAPSSKTKILSIIVSALVVLFLISFLFMIYRKLTAEDKDVSSLFKEETEYEPPLLLPSLKTEPTQPFTVPTFSFAGTTTSSSANTTAAGSENTEETTTATITEANSPPSIRVIEKTEIMTEPADQPATTVEGTSGPGQTSAEASKNTSKMTEQSTTETTSQRKTDTSSKTVTSTAEAELPASVQIHRVDSSESPLIRLDYGIFIEKNDKGKPLTDLDQLKLDIFERQNTNDDWVKQKYNFIKETSNISLAVNFVPMIPSGGTLKSSLFKLIEEMKLNPDKPEEKNNQEEEVTETEKDKESESDASAEWDRFSLINYGSEIYQASEMSPYFVDAKLAISKSPIQEKSEKPLLHAALIAAIENSALQTNGSVVIITDGRYYGENELSAVEELAKTKRIPVHVIYLCDSEQENAEESEKVGRYSEAELRAFARKTRGDLCLVDTNSDKWSTQLTAALLSALHRDKEEGRFLTYESSLGSEPGGNHQVLLKLYLDGDLISTANSCYEIMPDDPEDLD